MIKIVGYTVKEIIEVADASQQQVSAWARKYQWQVVARLGTANIYSQDDVADFLHARRRTRLLHKAGWSDGRPGRGIVWDDSYDVECPRCGAMAVEKPPTRDELNGGEILPIYCEQCGLIAAG